MALQLFTLQQVRTALIKMRTRSNCGPTDIKISPDLAGVDYGESLPQQEVTAHSMPCDPPLQINQGRIYGPADGSVLYVLVARTDIQMLRRGRQERC